MAPAEAKPLTQRKRNRKRKRRAASSSSSSSSSSSDPSDDEHTQPVAKPKPQTESSSSESSDSSSDSSSSENEDEEKKAEQSSSRGRQEEKATLNPQLPRKFSPSPSPPPTALPSFLPSEDAADPAGKEQQLKNRFRRFWMASVADGFKDDLEEIRKEPNLSTSRLALLIDSLASGADVFATSSNNTTINEMEVVLN